jgi:hypothetical protein
MSVQAEFPSSGDRETILETLIVLAELERDELVRAGLATLHPADIAELLKVLEEPQVKKRSSVFLILTLPQKFSD